VALAAEHEAVLGVEDVFWGTTPQLSTRPKLVHFERGVTDTARATALITSQHYRSDRPDDLVSVSTLTALLRLPRLWLREQGHRYTSETEHPVVM